ncbi:hypothetical protein A3E39_00300 [Candidatus Uhrbacteria bacterium RIFCSPHIGHO2_12_FULL_60_25]|uniref:Uncharacterized protein n=1 Tax=Candidatus Uhrbacteria bacterium RIFCSPHIGHO2_12_FULL_60_25 TaxID=1802399 RepID=A0A1F7ULR6_9BACT|nr:MAG: hypothetical protein A3E39_00300 [Candidatus Uhrbacteria bacterium RIFCSPHIGHO2_12_FULL_60_25]
MTIPSFLSARSWPGLRPWLASVVGSVAVYELLSVLAWQNERHTLPDFTTALVTVPVSFMVAVLIIAALWSLLAGVPFTGGLAFVAKLLPLAWAVPLFDLVRSIGLAFRVGAPVVDGNGFLTSLATGGLLPLDTGITAGMRLGMFATVVTAAFVVWIVTKNAWRTAVTGLVASAVVTKTVYFGSALGLWYRITHGMPWTAGEPEISRSVLLAISNGYWWNNLYDRFPTAVDVQAAIGLRMTTAGLFVFGLGVLLVLIFIWQVPAWRRILAHVHRFWSMFDLALYAVGGAVLYAVLTKTGSVAGMGWFALGVAALLLAALRLASALQRSLHRLPQDERSGADQPVARGDMSPDAAEDVITIALLYVLIAAWVLGWPVFAAVLVYLAASHLTRDRSWASWPWSASVFRAVGAASLALGGLFFVTQTNKLTGLAIIICCAAAAHRLLVEFVWNPWFSRR